jgi:hypothetical protein
LTGRLKDLKRNFDRSYIQYISDVSEYDIKSFLKINYTSGENNDCGYRSLLKILNPHSSNNVNNVTFHTLNTFIPEGQYVDSNNMKTSDIIIGLAVILNLDISIVSTKDYMITKLIPMRPFVYNKKVLKNNDPLDFEFTLMSMDEYARSVIKCNCNNMGVIFHSSIHYEFSNWINDSCPKFILLEHCLWFSQLYEMYVNFWKNEASVEIDELKKIKNEKLDLEEAERKAETHFQEVIETIVSVDAMDLETCLSFIERYHDKLIPRITKYFNDEIKALVELQSLELDEVKLVTCDSKENPFKEEDEDDDLETDVYPRFSTIFTEIQSTYEERIAYEKKIMKEREEFENRLIRESDEAPSYIFNHINRTKEELDEIERERMVKFLGTEVRIYTSEGARKSAPVLEFSQITNLENNQTPLKVEIKVSEIDKKRLKLLVLCRSLHQHFYYSMNCEDNPCPPLLYEKKYSLLMTFKRFIFLRKCDIFADIEQMSRYLSSSNFMLDRQPFFSHFVSSRINNQSMFLGETDQSDKHYKSFEDELFESFED